MIMSGGGNVSRKRDDVGACGGSGLLKLQDDVELCGYEDVRILWDIFSKTQSAQTTPDRQRGKRAIIGGCKRRVRRADCSMSTVLFGQSFQPLSNSLSQK